MNSLYLAWQAPANTNYNKAWFPVGLLEADDVDCGERYSFRYTQGAKEAEDKVGFKPFYAFPDLMKKYVSKELFPLFKNRVVSHTRKDFAEYIEWMGLDDATTDPMKILAISGGARETDNLEIFPKVEKDSEGVFRVRFFIHGLKYLEADAKSRVLNLQEGEKLSIAVELNNPATGHAIMLHTDDYKMVGWAPRYLIPDLLECISDSENMRAKVVKVNAQFAPLNNQVLVELEGKMNETHQPMSSKFFLPIHGVMNG